MSIKSAVTISLVKEAEGGPFVFWHDLVAGCAKAAELGYDAVEVFAPNAGAIPVDELRQLTDEHNLQVAAVGTGGGWVIHKWHLCQLDAASRENAKDFIKGIIDSGAQLGAPAIIGSMQGRFEGEVAKEQAHDYLREALNELGQHAKGAGVPLIYEPLNRYESNLLNRAEDVVPFLGTLDTDNIVILADLFHMNIEETSIAEGLRTYGSHIGHVHFVDSNRRPAGCGHMEYAPIAAALKEVGYDKYASAEAFPWPDSDAAAKTTIDAFKQYLT
jgi:sugar phosphate isomerase/epimerase